MLSSSQLFMVLTAFQDIYFLVASIVGSTTLHIARESCIFLRVLIDVRSFWRGMINDLKTIHKFSMTCQIDITEEVRRENINYYKHINFNV